LSPDEAARLVPFDARGIELATYGPSDGVIDPHRVTLSYLRMARGRGCQVFMDSPLLAGHLESGTWRVTTPEREFHAKYVVNAAGPWAGEVGQRTGLDVPVAPYRRMVFSTGPTFHDVCFPLTVDVESGFYLRSEGQRVLMGRSNPSQPAGFHEGIDWSWLENVLETGVARFPWLGEATLDRRASWWGYYEVTPDHSPILGQMQGVPGWVNACGFSGHGVQQAAAVGRVIAEEIAEGRASSIDIDAFRYERFAAGRGETTKTERHIV
jgi:sarcosine oxidase subunit beta